MEKRNMVCRSTQFRADEDDRGAYIEGYFAVFDSIYEMCPGITESIKPGAFSGVLNDDVRALTNHDSTLVLGRNRSRTLELREDDRGLWGRITINQEDQDAMNLYHRVQRGDVDQCSFGFDIGEESVDFQEDGTAHWTISQVGRLYEVSICTFPAYQETSVAARKADTETAKKRSLEAWKEKMKNQLKGDK